jgi:hypothetical protein
VTLEYFPKCNISSENIDILLFFSYIQLTAKNSHCKKLTAGIVAEIDCWAQVKGGAIVAHIRMGRKEGR